MSADGVATRRLHRLRLELEDEQIALPEDDELAELLLAELDYARHPRAHEGVAPRYGALLGPLSAVTEDRLGPLEQVDAGGVPIETLRRLADGRSSFVVRAVGGPDRLVCFERTREYESSAVHIAQASGAVVLQRLGRGWVRLCTPQSVSTWDGTHWSSKPLADRVSTRLADVLGPAADRHVLDRLVELCTHWLGAGRVGATLVWSLDGPAIELDHLGLAAKVDIPPLDVGRRSQFAALLNALAQYDRAALVDPDGHVSFVGVQLRTDERTRREVPPYRGTRHTSGLRFSASEPGTVVFVVSSSGTLSVFRRGALLDTG